MSYVPNTTPFNCTRAQPSDRCIPVYGISEWEHVFLMAPHPAAQSQTPVEDCIELHRSVGMNQIVWNCGRSTVDYRTDLANASAFGIGKAGAESASYKARIIHQYCPLRRALEHGHRTGVSILGRLAMNRHYGPKTSSLHTC